MVAATDKVQDFTVGIEEEYLLIDRQSRDLVREAPRAVLERCEQVLGDQVTTEFMQSQIEVATKVCGSIQDAATDLGMLRRTVGESAHEAGLGLVAASSHPFADWGDQKATEKERYRAFAEDMQGVVRRMVICGMHVHIGIADPDMRIDLMSQLSYFLPHLLALSTSSPFWRGEDTGLASYRLSIFDNLPRTGLPNNFDSWTTYRRHLDILIGAGVIKDSSTLWWDLRPSERFPTLELRICDVCTRLEDAVSIAALFRSLVHMLYRLRRRNQRWRTYAEMLIAENRWRAQRYGTDGGLIDFGVGEMKPYSDLLGELIDLVLPDAEILGCLDEVMRVSDILTRGSSAHRQRAAFARAIGDGASRDEAFRAVVDMLVEESMVGV